MKPFSWRLALLIGCSGILTNTLWVAFNAYVPLFLQAGHPLAEASIVTGFALSPLAANFIMTWDNLIHMFLNPWVGARSDSTWNRFGRRKPWLLLGFPIALLGFTLIPYAASIVALMLFILLTNLGTGLYRAPLRAWVGDFFAPSDRPKAESMTHVLGGLALVIVALVGGRLFDSIGRTAPFWLTVAVVVPIFVLVAIAVRESKPVQAVEQNRPITFFKFAQTLRAKHNRNILLVAISLLCFTAAHAAFQANLSPFVVFEINATAGRSAQLLGLATIVYILAAVPSSFFAMRFGARRVMLVGVIIYAVSALLIMRFAFDERTFLPLFLMTGFAWALISVNALPLILSFDGGDQAGLFTGLYFFAFQLANIVGPVLAGGLIAFFASQRAMLALVAICMFAALMTLGRVNYRVT